MKEIFSHETVLLHETVMSLAPQSSGIYVDATMGSGGHTRKLLEASAPQGTVIALDQDERAIEAAKSWQGAYEGRLDVIRANFREITTVLQERGIQKINGLLCELGVSSPQLDEADRGFSYQHDAPLDMRMDRRIKQSAKDLLERLEAPKLADLFWRYGEERWAKRIAEFIVTERARRPLVNTGDLVEVIKKAVPQGARKDGPHPAKRVFQALRIAVNDELGALESLLEQLPDLLAPEANVAIITFHSLEDRIVKQFFAAQAITCVCPPRSPICTCGHQARFTVVTRKPILPSGQELSKNPRARSAKLRVAKRK